MKRRFAVILLAALLACGPSRPPAQPARPAATEATATAAYEAKSWSACAQQWLEIAEQFEERTHRKRRVALYWAACCHALGGRRDAALAALDAAIAAGYRDISHLETDPDLAALRTDPRWSRQLARVEASLGAPQLRRELLALAAEDQAARNAWIDSVEARQPPDETSRRLAQVIAIDDKSTRALKAAISKYGWPGRQLVGDDGAAAASLLALHADRDHAFQVDVLARMKPMVERGDVEPRDYAYLHDRVAVAEKRPQRYGTQLDGDKPFPIEDEAHVDARRAAVGLPPLAEYLASQRDPK